MSAIINWISLHDHSCGTLGKKDTISCKEGATAVAITLANFGS